MGFRKGDFRTKTPRHYDEPSAPSKSPRKTPRLPAECNRSMCSPRYDEPSTWSDSTPSMMGTSAASSLENSPRSQSQPNSSDTASAEQEAAAVAAHDRSIIKGASAAGGLVGTVTGCATGNVAGACVGLIAAPFTLGLSLPVGVLVGGTIGSTTGFCTGSLTGALVGMRISKAEREADLHDPALFGPGARR